MEDDENKIVALRRNHLQELREQGQPFPNDFRRTHLATELHEAHSESSKESLQESPVPTTVAGRVVLRRLMG